MKPQQATIAEVRAASQSSPLAAAVHAQIDELTRKDSAAGKPYWELKLRDATDSLVLRAWNDTPAFEACETLERGEPVCVEGEFLLNGAFGLDAKRWKLRQLTEEESATLFDGSAEQRAAVERDLGDIRTFVGAMTDERLRAVCELFLTEHGARFSRAAAARQNHHAHRGGLLRHTAQMMRSAGAISSVYPFLNRDLLLAGTLFHDSGKLWEMCPPEASFEMPRELRGELLGHISIGIELVNTLWRKLPLENWKAIEPASEEVRLHLLHLIASHHGSLEFGSPVEPRTPEAMALHYIDNLDARLEMITAAYGRLPQIAPGIFERVRPLNISPVAPLASVPPAED